MKLCIWCEEEIERPAKRLSAKEWATIKLHRLCVTAWRHHQCPKSPIEQPPDRNCSACGAQLVRKEKENWQAWVKRKCCDKSCAATAKIRRVRPTIIIVPVPYQQRVHVKQYIPGTPEFKQIAALYGG